MAMPGASRVSGGSTHASATTYSSAISSSRRIASADQSTTPGAASTPSLPRTSSTLMIAAYGQNGDYRAALRLFWEMNLQGVRSDRVVFVEILSVCAKTGDLATGISIHLQILGSGILHCDVVLRTAIVTMYGKCGDVEAAKAAFDDIEQPNNYSWNSLIAAYGQKGHCKEALETFQRMDRPDKYTFLSVLGACCHAEEAQEIHARVVSCGLEMDVMVATQLIKCGRVAEARRVFEKVCWEDAVGWNSMLAAYAQNGLPDQALALYWALNQAGVSPDEATFVSLLDAAAALCALKVVLEIHAQVSSRRIQSHIVDTALVFAYGKCGRPMDSRKVFDSTNGEVVTHWNAMIEAYSQNDMEREAIQLFKYMDLKGIKQDEVSFINVISACSTLEDLAEGTATHGHSKAALELFETMVSSSLRPSSVTYVAVLGACSDSGALTAGRRIHEHILASKAEWELPVGNALISMYGKCGSVEDARLVFTAMRETSLFSWNSMLAAYTQNHQGSASEAFDLAREMVLHGIKPNEATFVSILYACSHAGRFDEAYIQFVAMESDHGVRPVAEHYGCMVDLFGRLGWLAEAEHAAKNAPKGGDIVSWMSVLGACKIHSDDVRAKQAAEKVLQVSRGSLSINN
ncbi:pentatricopeptide repeat-containing protein At4g33990-like [Selaginella moellendorffii]|uniref:pentatricopeptide repeat-containing protein At4g33990-like n=1 Tax=Selaginella moellendorffii TaxID=88036 RepID=UPI000D1C7A48|nr:pentatricopeptide repeat-containing protein At4g33990-like [Selaginella moellendorffii]|eukprot:XP_024536577.1 pentatricopeptide repeat-containing protein At4g33990-like [Selaginella moellendorffii]